MIALISLMALKTEADFGGKHVRICLQTVWVGIRVVAESGSVQEMALQLGVKKSVKVVAPRDHEVFGVILRKSCVGSFVYVVAVVAADVHFLCQVVAAHHVPRAGV